MGQVAREPGQESVQTPAHQVALGPRLGSGLAGVRPGGPFPLHTEVVVGRREMGAVEAPGGGTTRPFQEGEGTAGAARRQVRLLEAREGFDEVQRRQAVGGIGGRRPVKTAGGLLRQRGSQGAALPWSGHDNR